MTGIIRPKVTTKNPARLIGAQWNPPGFPPDPAMATRIAATVKYAQLRCCSSRTLRL
jgi:hypothetical protein